MNKNYQTSLFICHLCELIVTFFFSWRYCLSSLPVLLCVLQTVVVGSYLIAHGFFSVYNMCVDTLFLCFCKCALLLPLSQSHTTTHTQCLLLMMPPPLCCPSVEDLERNDGSMQKPFYMSKNLMKILNKKNQRPKDWHRPFFPLLSLPCLSSSRLQK